MFFSDLYLCLIPLSVMVPVEYKQTISNTYEFFQAQMRGIVARRIFCEMRSFHRLREFIFSNFHLIACLYSYDHVETAKEAD